MRFLDWLHRRDVEFFAAAFVVLALLTMWGL
jgi:hypothetical protein